MQTTKQKEKKSDYINRMKWQRVLRQTEHSLTLATTPEEDERLWQRYDSTLKKLEKLEKSENASDPEHRRKKKRKRQIWRPVFNEEYVALTRKMIELDKRRRVCPKKEIPALAEQFNAINAQRMTVTDFHNRKTGELRQRRPKPETQEQP